MNAVPDPMLAVFGIIMDPLLAVLAIVVPLVSAFAIVSWQPRNQNGKNSNEISKEP